MAFALPEGYIVQRPHSSFVSENNLQQFATVAATQLYNPPTGNAYSYSQMQQSQYNSHQQQHAAPIVTKRFYIHSAPEEEDNEIDERFITIGKPRKNYNIVFIRAPHKAPSKTKLKIVPAINEDKTVIYVLAKKPTESEIEAHVQEYATTTAKPEVYFIKYKTNEEAAHAQHTIQAQYDALGGSTEVSHEGVAPVTSVIGSLDGLRNSQGYSGAVRPEEQYQNSNNAYLPPAKH